ncbi:HAD hydrolase family protein [Endozoicomonas arenosclerae]|uniref:HAD hydrolase family protein n=1 Tax=Endozoicomonas arenosclerae TaxID=1633495 RepID=UPI000780225F|nr:HAD hydrolase family protein [Endozoicomonas arenosclerae]
MKYFLQPVFFSLFLIHSLVAVTVYADGDRVLVVNSSVPLIPEKADRFAIPLEASVGGGGFDQYPGDGYGRGGGRSPLPIITLMLRSSSGKLNLKGSGSDQSPSQQGSGQRRQSDGGAIGWGRSGEGLPPDDGWDEEKQLKEFESLLAQLDKEMANLIGEVVLLSDLDETLLPANPVKRELTKRLREMFAAFVNKWRDQGKLRLVVVTGAIIGHDEWRYFADHQLPEPDYLISLGSGARAWNAAVNVMARPGTGFHSALMPAASLLPDNLHIRADGFHFDRYVGYTAGLTSQLARLFAAQFVSITNVQNTEPGPIFNLTVGADMDLNNKETRDFLRQAAFNLFGAIAKIRFNPEKHEMILSLPMTKGEWVSRLARALGLKGATIMAAGDSEIDKDMLTPRPGSHFSVHTAIVVGNAGRGFKAQMRGSPGVVMSTFSCILGVAQGFLSGLRQIVLEQAMNAVEV